MICHWHEEQVGSEEIVIKSGKMTIHVMQWQKNLVKPLPTVTWKVDYMPNKLVALEKDAGKQDISHVCWFLLNAFDKVL